MISAKIPRLALPLSILGLCMAQSAPWRPGTNSIPVRGVPQAVFYYPGDAGSSERPCILFAPGDGVGAALPPPSPRRWPDGATTSMDWTPRPI